MKIKVKPPQTKSLSPSRFLREKGKMNLFTLNYKTFSTCAPTTASAINSEVEPQPLPLFSSLPDDIIINFLVRISRSYYPKFSLVSKKFCSLTLSIELSRVRNHFKTRENILVVCLQLPDRQLPSWFSLWIKPDRRRPSWFSLLTKPGQTLTNYFDLKNKSIGNALLVPIRSSCTPFVPTILYGLIGSKIYAVSQTNTPTSSLVMSVRNEGTDPPVWYKAPPMKVTRECNAVGRILDGKIYVMGGCSADESTNWAEVFDTKTRTWESLPDPGPELRFSLIKEMKVKQGKIYVSSSADKDYVYDPKEDRWDVEAKAALCVVKRCAIKKVRYACGKKNCRWYDTKHNKWRLVKGLEVFIRKCGSGFITFAINSGKLMILWDKFDDSQKIHKKIVFGDYG